MKHLTFSILIISIFTATAIATGQERNSRITDKNGTVKLLGKINQQGLLRPPFKDWFQPGFENYKVDMETMQRVKNDLSKYSIKVFLGTWCGDSKREVPRFNKVLEAINFPKGQLTTIAVDYLKPNYKKSPGGEEKGMNIVKVPTFIFYKNGEEVNRIIEFPVVSIEKDIAAIVRGEGYVPNYVNIPTLPVD
ncbi:MAG: thioredoxin family protein [Eudoraea sp.]|nr:thioredoxin family protein [Eudoraea sp.]